MFVVAIFFRVFCVRSYVALRRPPLQPPSPHFAGTCSWPAFKIRSPAHLRFFFVILLPIFVVCFFCVHKACFVLMKLPNPPPPPHFTPSSPSRKMPSLWRGRRSVRWLKARKRGTSAPRLVDRDGDFFQSFGAV